MASFAHNTATRRGFLGMLGAMAGLVSVPKNVFAKDAPQLKFGPAQEFSWEMLLDQAQQLAQTEYQPAKEIPKPWTDLSYDLYKSIWFDIRASLWRDTTSPIRLDFLHPGLYFPRAVEINVVEQGRSRSVIYDPSVFLRTDKVPQLPEDESLGYTGFKVRGELEKDDVHQEYLVFQGASYFRAIGAEQIYGVSARGLTLDVADAVGEEFPDFTHFWIENPAPGTKTVTIHALLNSPSATGAYQFTTTPGETTITDVKARIFARRRLTHFGLAPGTSMFLFDETNRGRFDDFRPAVHDSDGLLIVNGNGETLWRPLANPERLQISSFVDNNPQGFGLMQRSQDFSQFADMVAQYHKRPGLWVEPGEDWGKGSVTLVEIPASREIYDNIVAYWRPAKPVEAGGAFDFSYRLHWGKGTDLPTDVARIINTRMGARFKGGYICTIDFAPHELLPEFAQDIKIHVSTNTGFVTGGYLERNPKTGGQRLAFTFDPGDATQMEIRAQLTDQGTPISEVWLYRWSK